MQERFDDAFEAVAINPRRPRPGVDVKKVADLSTASIYRLRVGGYRAAYLLLDEHRRAIVLCIAPRGLGYDRIIAMAITRGKQVGRG